MTRLGFVLTVCASLLCVPLSATAQLSDSDRERLVGEIEAAAANLSVDRFPDLAKTKAEVAERIAVARNYFEARTDPANAKAWMEYLNVEPLLATIQSDESPMTIGREANELRFRLVGTAPGLELRVLRQLRQSVERLISAVVFRDKERSQEALARQLNSLAGLIREIDANPTPNQIASLSAVTGVVESSGQASGVIESLQDTFDHPNVAVMVSESMVQQAVEQNVNEDRPVCECILGTRIIGNALMDGVVTADLIPSQDSALINVTLVGSIYSRNTGYNGPVKLRTVGNGFVTASRVVQLGQSGIHLSPTNVSQASLNTRITAIEHPLRLVRKIARKKAAEQKPTADRIALQKLRAQVKEQFDQQTEEVINVDSPELEDAKRMLQRLSLEEPPRHWSSTDDALHMEAVFRRTDQLASVTRRPAVDEDYEVTIQLHESALDNALSPVLAGRTVREGELNRLLEESGRSLEPEAEDEEDEAPFEIDFARLRPIIFEAREQSLRLGVRGTRFAQGNRELKQPMEITAVYVPEETDGVVRLVRQGEVDVDFPGRKRLTVSQAGLRRTIQKKFSKVFPAEVLDRPLEVPADAKLESMRGRVFHPRLVAAADGWLTIGVR